MRGPGSTTPTCGSHELWERMSWLCGAVAVAARPLTAVLLQASGAVALPRALPAHRAGSACRMGTRLSFSCFCKRRLFRLAHRRRRRRRRPPSLAAGRTPSAPRLGICISRLVALPGMTNSGGLLHRVALLLSTAPFTVCSVRTARLCNCACAKSFIGAVSHAVVLSSLQGAERQRAERHTP